MPHTSPTLVLPGTGAALLSAADGSIVLRLSCGRFLRVQEPPPDLLDAVAEENPPTDEIAAYLQTLRDAITTRGAADAETRWPPQRRTVGLVGEGTIVDDIAEAFRGWDVDLQQFTSARQLLDNRDRRLRRAETDYSLVLAYADTPRDRVGWERLDTLPKSGCAWLRAYREGQICFVDPLSVSGEDPSSEQVLRRRLAANPTPELFAAWHEAVVHSEPLSSSAQALTTGRVLTVALAWTRMEEGTLPLRSTLWKFVPATGRISEHIVLGYDCPHRPAEAVIRR